MDDFCPTHGYEHMVHKFGNPIPYCAECERRKLPALRCDECDNGVEPSWTFCPWCSRRLREDDPDDYYRGPK